LEPLSHASGAANGADKEKQIQKAHSDRRRITISLGQRVFAKGKEKRSDPMEPRWRQRAGLSRPIYKTLIAKIINAPAGDEALWLLR
jgi:hypothetical protein